jgi:TusA-related sulfurtransferase
LVWSFLRSHVGDFSWVANLFKQASWLRKNLGLALVLLLPGETLIFEGKLKKGKCHIIDLRGFIAPFTLLKMSQAFRALEIGDTLEICWGYTDNPEDLFKILPRSSYEVLSMAEPRQNGNECKLKLKKIASPETPSAFCTPRFLSDDQGANK